ncbi:MAG: hypothetical protein AAGM22_09140 [Acidobacteriota bacterium]
MSTRDRTNPPPDDGALTAYIREVGDRRAEVSGPVFDAFWTALSRAVRRELNRRGLWTSPPRYLGVESTGAWNDEALEELVSECYLFLMRRLRTLHQHLKLKPNVDGLVILNIKNFLYERQKSNDPLGYRIFDIARSAVRLAVEKGALSVVGGDPRIQNSTALAFPPATDERPGAPIESRRDQAQQLAADRCARWVDALIPDLLLANGRRRLEVAERLAELLASLEVEGVHHVAFKTLVDGLKDAARERWQAVWLQEQGRLESSRAGRRRHRHPARPAEQTPGVVFQSPAFEEQESFSHMTRRVSEAIDSLPDATPHLRHLVRLWDYLRTTSDDPGTAAIPSRRRVAEQLGIPRYLLPELYRRLGDIIERCRDTRPVPSAERKPGPFEAEGASDG